ncbi:MAG TPA: hypothetical protein VFE01_10620 [Terracidiphilus sp.]|jgi:hypothetical protein|nr:hypothetical protein [Terracidiphilus sp.]
MRTEDIVGLSFFALLIPSLVVAFSGARASLTPKQRALWRGSGLALIGAAFLAFGLANMYFIHNSPRPVVEGNLWDIRELTNTKAHSTQFRITDATGHAVLIRCKYTGPGLVEGERARVLYVAYNQKLVELDMLSGPYHYWHFQESSGEQACWGWVAIGVGCLFFAVHQLMKSRQRQTTSL